MTVPAEVLDAVLGLPADVQDELVHELAARRQGGSPADPAWNAEISSRVGDIMSGRVQTIPLSEIKPNWLRGGLLVAHDGGSGLHPEARAEFLAEVDYLSHQRPGLGDEFEQALYATVDMIGIWPQAGVVWPGLAGAVEGARSASVDSRSGSSTSRKAVSSR